jgi:cytochrome P450
MNSYFQGLIRERRQAPASLLVGARLGDRSVLTDVQIVNVAKTFLVGGNETTTFLLTSTMHRLATDPALADEIARSRNGSRV